MPVPPNPPVNPPRRPPPGPPGQQKRPLTPPQRPLRSTAAATNDEAGFYAGVVSIIFGIASIFVAPKMLVSLAVVAGVYAIIQKRAIWGCVGLFCALIGVFSSPSMTAMLGLGHLAPSAKIVTSATDVFPGISKKDEQDEINRQKAAEAMDEAVQSCRDKRLNGQYRTYLEAAKCSHDATLEAFRKINYPYMDLIEKVVAEREDLAAKLDKGEISEDDAEEANNAFLDGIADEVAAREKQGH